MNLLNIISTATTNLTAINEFGQNPAHADFNVWVSFFMLFLWPLLIFVGYKFISYTMKKLEASGYFDDVKEEVSTESKEEKVTV